jgi:hypothetical protein
MISMVLSALLAYATLRGVFTALDSWWRWISKEYLLDRKKKKEEEKKKSDGIFKRSKRGGESARRDGKRESKGNSKKVVETRYGFWRKTEGRNQKSAV